MDPLPYVYIWLGLVIAAFALGVWRRRARWVVLGAFTAVPVCLLLSWLFWVASPMAVAAITVANVASAWALSRGRRLTAALLLVPFAAFVAAAAVKVPPWAAGESTTDVRLADLDLDGDLDVVLARGHHAPTADEVLVNDGKGRLEARDLGGLADPSFGAAAADLDGDRDVDVVISNDRHSPKRIYFNDGQARFADAGTFGAADWNSRRVVLADFDADGRPDLVVANRDRPDQPGGSHICMNDGAGRFRSCRVLAAISGNSIVAADLNADGSLDLIVPHADRGQSVVFINDGRGGFEQRHPLGGVEVSVGSAAAGDLDGDGLPEIVMADRSHRALLYANRGGGTFSEGVPLGEEGDRVFSVAVADLNRDGEADVVLGMGGMPSAILLNDGTGRAFTRLALGDGRGIVYGLGIGDLNGDGLADIVAGRALAPNMLYMNSLDPAARAVGDSSLTWQRLGRD